MQKFNKSIAAYLLSEKGNLSAERSGAPQDSIRLVEGLW